MACYYVGVYNPILMHSLTYPEALDYLYSFTDYGSLRTYRYSPETFDLGRMRALMARLGDPQERFPAIHVAGTKGKGSVSALCASALRSAGYRTGFYTSPHLQDFAERIQVGGCWIPHERLAALVEEIQPHVAALTGLTTFELTTALAFLHFARERVQAAVIEVGLGGRLDATNILNRPVVTVITSISHDHTHLLGNSLAEIAGEKAGIIKAGVPVVSAPQLPNAQRRVEEVAAERGAPLTLVGRDWRYASHWHSLAGQSFHVWSPDEQDRMDAVMAGRAEADWTPLELEIPLLGFHQVTNAVTAYAALRLGEAHGLPISEEQIRSGFKNLSWPGRFEILSRSPIVVADAAHNRDSARKLRTALDDYFPGQPVTLVFGASTDKDVAGMFDELLPRVGYAIMTQAVHPRAWEPEELAEMARQRGCPAVVVLPTRKGLERALEVSEADGVVLATGSLFVVAEVRAAMAAVPVGSD